MEDHGCDMAAVDVPVPPVAVRTSQYRYYESYHYDFGITSAAASASISTEAFKMSRVVSVKVRIAEKSLVKTMQFDPTSQILDVCRIIRDKLPEANLGNAKDYGLFLADDDPKKGVWMENGRSLEYYLVRQGDLLEYKKKIRTLRVKMLDGTVKTLLVDDSQPVNQLMVVICTRIGITNHEEYSLVREIAPTDPHRHQTLTKKDDKAGMGTLTLGRNKEKKMEQMRKQLHTDDELNWIDHSKTLREQGIDENEQLLLRRKYFFNDQNIDSRDPVQLNLLYVQCRDGILDGTHPVSLQEAIEFAGLQCHIQFGDYQDTKHRSGFLDLKEFLPKEYVRTKNAEKNILNEYRNHIGTSEVDAKVKYTHICRGLKTYGVTFFLVKEKIKGKNKLAPRLLGVNKDCVMRVDEKTKAVMTIWPLDQVRRWAASPNTFTLDFGDYQDQFYSVQTMDGEKIAQLIAGYIDIILKKKKAKDHLGIEGDEGSTMLEDTVAPAKATLMSHGTIHGNQAEFSNVALPGVIRSGVNGELPYSQGSMQQPEFGAIGGTVVSSQMPPQGQQPKVYDTMSKSQRALIANIAQTKEQFEKAAEDLMDRAELPPLGEDPASKQWRDTEKEVKTEQVMSSLAAMDAATAEVVQLTAVPDDVNHVAVGAAISTISSNLPDMTKDVKTVAALMEEDQQGDSLLEAARKLCGAFSDLMVTVNPEEPKREKENGFEAVAPVPPPRRTVIIRHEQEERQQVFSAASRIGDYSHAMIRTMQEPDDAEREFQDTLTSLAKAVATSTARLVINAKTVSEKCEDRVEHDKVIYSTTQCAFATSQLVACARVVAPTIESPACQEQLTDAAKQVAKSVHTLLSNAEVSCKDERSVGDLRQAAREVTLSLDGLLQHIKAGPQRAKTTQQDAELDQIIHTSDRLITYQGTSTEMIRQAKVLAEATTHMVTNIKGDAEVQDDVNSHEKLMGAAKRVATATTVMIEAAKTCASSPETVENQMALRHAAEDLQCATKEAAEDQIRYKALLKLERAAKQAAASAAQTISAAQACDTTNTNYNAQEQLKLRCQETAEYVPRVIGSVKKSQGKPDDWIAQLELLRTSEELLLPATAMVNSSRAAAPSVTDQSSAYNLQTYSRQLDQHLAELRLSITQFRQITSKADIEYAIEVVTRLDDEVVEYRQAAMHNQLMQLPGETAQSSSNKLATSSKSVGSSIAKMLSATAANDIDGAGSGARDTADSLGHLTSAVRGVVATGQSSTNDRMFDCSRDLLDKSIKLFYEVKYSFEHRDDPDSQQRLAQVAKAVTFSLNGCVNCLPGQRDLDIAIHTVSTTVTTISVERLQPTNRPYPAVQDDFMHLGAQLSEATNMLVAALGGPPHLLAEAVNYYVEIFKRFISVGMELAYLTQDPRQREEILEALRILAQTSSRFLLAIKESAADPHAPYNRQKVTQSSKIVVDSINRLLDICTTSAAWQKECDNALRNIENMRYMLLNPVEPVNDLGYFDCLDVVSEKAKLLGDGMSGIAQHAKRSELDQFCGSVREVSGAVCGLAEAGAQAAYLVGVSDLRSTAGRPGLIRDQHHFQQSVRAVCDSCEHLRNPRITKDQVLEAATVIAKNTSAIANICRDAASRTNNGTAKKTFINCAKDVAHSTANLIKSIKTLDADFIDVNRQHCAQSTQPLLTSLDSLLTFANSPEFASIPAKISLQGREAQEPLIKPALSMLDGSCEMIVTAKSLAINPKDMPTWQTLASHSKIVSDAIKSLVTSIRERAPGQSECDAAIERMNQILQRLNKASLEAVSQGLEASRMNTEQGFHDQISSSAQQALEHIEPLRSSAKAEAETLGRRVNDIMNTFDPLADSCVGAASLSFNSRGQLNILEQCRTVSECQLQLLYASKDAGGNPKAVQFHEQVDEASSSLREALIDLQNTASQAVSERGAMATMLDTISRAIAKTDENLTSGEEMSYVDYQTRMVKTCKEIARISQEMVSKSYTDVNSLGGLALHLSKNYQQLAEDSRGAVAVCSGPDVAIRLRTSVQELGTACIETVKNAGTTRSNPNDAYAKRDLSESSHLTNEKVALVLAALQSGSRGTQACINAASTVSGIIGDLDTTIMFATAGTLNPEREGDVFSDHRESILKTAKALVEDTKALVSGAASSQEQLAVAAQNAVRTIIQLSDVVKCGAAALTSQNSESQVLVINAVKDVAAALANLIQATKNASGKSFNDPAMAYLKEAAKVMVTNVTSLLKTVKTVEDEHQRGTRALEATIEAIAQEIRSYDASDQPSKHASPEELIRVTKPITDTTARTVAAGQSLSQDEVIVSANMARKVIQDLLATCKAAAMHAETPDARYRALDAGRDVAIKVRELLQALHMVLQKPTPETRQILGPASRNIAQAVTDLVGYAEILKGADWIDPSDPTVIAENELLGAANSIDAAARKLATLRPRVGVKEADESLNFDEQILEAAKSITNAVGALVKAASAAQRELVQQGRIDPRPKVSSEDYQWSEGLVSAARMVAAATHSLCEAANALVLGNASEERLISATKQVASSTAQLLVACKVKADLNSKGMQRLQAAGNAVKIATEHLVRAAKQAIDAEDERTLVINQRMVSGITQVMDAQEQVLRKEKELDEARYKLAAIRKAKYQKDGSPDNNPYYSDY